MAYSLRKSGGEIVDWSTSPIVADVVGDCFRASGQVWLDPRPSEGGYVAVGQMPQTVDREALAGEIDKLADSLRLAIVGDPVRCEEYRLARDEAKAYRDNNYVGLVPSSVQSWATAKGWSAKQAADDISDTAQAWESALYAIRSIRLIGKEAVRNAASDSAALAAKDGALAQLRGVAA